MYNLYPRTQNSRGGNQQPLRRHQNVNKRPSSSNHVKYVAERDVPVFSHGGAQDGFVFKDTLCIADGVTGNGLYFILISPSYVYAPIKDSQNRFNFRETETGRVVIILRIVLLDME